MPSASSAADRSGHAQMARVEYGLDAAFRERWAAHRREDGVLLDLIAGIVSLATALAFLGVLLYKVWSVPLWIVILLGAAMMVASFVESARSEESR